MHVDPHKLTPREKQIALLLLKGEKRTAMAARLEIHVRTVDFHLLNLRRKVRADGIVTLALACVRLNGELKR